MAIKLGLGLPQIGQYDISRDVAAVARTAESIGYEGLWVFDDPKVGIAWPIPPVEVSDKDRSWPDLDPAVHAVAVEGAT